MAFAISVIASHLEYSGGNRWELTAPFASAACESQASTCKCAMSRQMRALTGASKMLYVGDGRSDYCVSMEEADLILAKDSLLGYCQQQQLPHKPSPISRRPRGFSNSLIQQRQAKQLPAHAEEAALCVMP